MIPGLKGKQCDLALPPLVREHREGPLEGARGIKAIHSASILRGNLLADGTCSMKSHPPWFYPFLCCVLWWSF